MTNIPNFKLRTPLMAYLVVNCILQKLEEELITRFLVPLLLIIIVVADMCPLSFVSLQIHCQMVADLG